MIDQNAELQSKVADTQRRMAEMQRRRHLTDSQRHAITQAISAFAGQKITIISATGDSEAGQYAKEFESVFRESGWECDLKNSFLPTDFQNVLAVASQGLNQVEKGTRVPPAGYHPLVAALVEVGLSDNRGKNSPGLINISNSVPMGELGLFVGPKEIPEDLPDAAANQSTPPSDLDK